MPPTLRVDHATREFLQCRLRLRPDLIVSPNRSKRETWYQIESPATGRFFRVGETEYMFLSLMDGETTVAEALSLTSRQLGPRAIHERQAETLVTWLTANHLAEGDNTEAVNAGEMIRRKEDRSVRERLNPFWIKIPFGVPDRLILAVMPWVNWMHSTPAIGLAIVLWILASWRIALDWPRFCDSFESVFHRSNWFCFSAIWIGLKCLHELSHAVVCRRYGGPVRETGMILILFAPVAYVDVTSSCRFCSKWQRIHTSAAGIYAEITLASLAALLWSQTESTVLSHWLVNVIWTATLTTILFNANPLMKFDGYYILADWLDIQSLSARGHEAVKQFARRWLFGRQTRNPADIGRTRHIVFAYGLCSQAWNLLLTVGMIAAASALWHGTGVVLATGAVLVWISRPLFAGLMMIRELAGTAPEKMVRPVSLVTLLALAFAALLGLTPWPLSRTAPGFVEYRNLASVRANTPGFIVAIHVVDGEVVEQGQMLIELENREMDTEVNDLKIAVQQSQLRQQQHLQASKLADLQVEVEQCLTYERRLHEKQERLARTRVCAPIAGRIMARDLVSRIGTYTQEGDELLVVGQESEKEFRASLSQEDANRLGATVNTLASQKAIPARATHESSKKSDQRSNVRIRLHQRGSFQATVRMMTPRASRTPPHPSLAVSGGGLLTVRQITSQEVSANRNDQFEFVEPRVTVAFTFAEPATLREVPTGTRGFVALNQHTYGSLGEGLWRTLEKFVREKFEAAWRDSNSESSP